MKVQSEIGVVRRLEWNDIPAIVELRSNFTPVAREVLTSEAESFLTNPFYDPELAPLVYEREGQVVGMIGVIPRRLKFQGTVLRCAVATQFLVDPKHQRSGIGNALIMELLAGPQELTYVDCANDQARHAFEPHACLPVDLLSLYFFRVLRPATLACSVGLKLKSVLPLVSALESPVARLFLPHASACTREVLDEETFAENFEAFTGGYALWPEYQMNEVRWLFATLQNRNHLGRLRRVALRDSRGELLGWYMYLISPRRIAEVVHLAATEESAPLVLDCLFRDALDEGCAAVRGRMIPRLVSQLSAKKISFNHGAWTLLHSRHKDVLDAFHYGQAYMMYLDGEMLL